MKYYTFLPELHAPILARTKYSTIRERIKVMPGERFALRHWTGKPYRSKMGILGTALCRGICPVWVYSNKVMTGFIPETIFPGISSIHPGIMCESDEFSDRFAKMEGFDSRADFFRHFVDYRRVTEEEPFRGCLTIWDPNSFEPEV